MAGAPADRTAAQARTEKATVKASEAGVAGAETQSFMAAEQASGITGCIAGVAGSVAAGLGGRTGPAVGADPGSESSEGRATRSASQIGGATAKPRPGLVEPRTEERMRDAAAWSAIAERVERTWLTFAAA